MTNREIEEFKKGIERMEKLERKMYIWISVIGLSIMSLIVLTSIL